MKKPVYTFHAPIPGHHPEEETKLLLLWKQNWAAAGYEPIVLNEYIAAEHPLYAKFMERVKELPTINTPAYELACYVRWIAMAQVGGGIMTDHDLFIYDAGFNFGTKKPDQIALFQGHTPCLTYGSKKAYDKAVIEIMDYKVTEKDIEVNRQVPHVSDMYMFFRGGIQFTPKTDVKSFGEDGWERAPFVHYSNACMKNNRPRYRHIQVLRKML